MSSFTKPVILEILPNRNYRVYEEFSFYDTDDHNKLITVPKGFETNLASIPRLLWSIFPPNGEYSKAAIVHDYMYRTPSAGFTQKEADKIFNDGMKVLSVATWRRKAVYAAVRVFGSHAYNMYRGKNIFGFDK